MPEVSVAGTHATPTYSDEKKRGWLRKLFPQGIVHQETPQRLMAQRVPPSRSSKRPGRSLSLILPTGNTRSGSAQTATFRRRSSRTLRKTDLATSSIVQHYVHNKEKYGKTLIFADRWAQCEAICTLLEAQRRQGRRGLFTRCSRSWNSGGAKSTHTSRKRPNPRDILCGQLDVLVNIKMLTEGTDVPDVQTVF